jgi:hypothetical protein
MKNQEKTILTSESWYPTINGKVRVQLMQLSNRMWRVCVWGGDDFGLEQDFPPTGRQEAKVLYAKLIDGTTQAQMRAFGMVNA